MPRIAITSDLHFDLTSALTPPEKVAQLATEIHDSHPAAVVIAGDIGHPLSNFKAALESMQHLEAQLGLVPGNHDVWRDPKAGSRDLWEQVLPSMSIERGFRWLETDPIVVGRVGVVGSMAWYDYSVSEAVLGKDSAFFERLKPQLSNDAHWVDWEWSDVQFAAMQRERMVALLERMEADKSIDRVVVVTHVPVFREQLRRDLEDAMMHVANAYFSSLKMGCEVARFPKVRAVVSGHLHLSIRALVHRSRMPDIHAAVIGSDYGAPTWLVLDL